MRTGVVSVLVIIGLAAAACPGLLSNARISEGQADKMAERNAEVAASLPVFADSRLTAERQHRCEGALQREDSSCTLTLEYETSRPLVEVLSFYEASLASDGWSQLGVALRARYFEADGIFIEVFARVPLLTCPDAHVELEAARACEEKWISNEGGEFWVTISPD